VAAAVESVGVASVFQYAPGADVTNGGRFTTTWPPPLPAVGALPDAPPPGFDEPAVPGAAPPVPVSAPAALFPVPAVPGFDEPEAPAVPGFDVPAAPGFDVPAAPGFDEPATDDEPALPGGVIVV